MPLVCGRSATIVRSAIVFDYAIFLHLRLRLCRSTVRKGWAFPETGQLIFSRLRLERAAAQPQVNKIIETASQRLTAMGCGIAASMSCRSFPRSEFKHKARGIRPGNASMKRNQVRGGDARFGGAPAERSGDGDWSARARLHSARLGIRARQARTLALQSAVSPDESGLHRTPNSIAR